MIDFDGILYDIVWNFLWDFSICPINGYFDGIYHLPSGYLT